MAAGPKLWDIHTPQNTYERRTSRLLDAAGKSLDTSWPDAFGFREFWIEGRDFYLNGTRIFLSRRAARQRPGRRGAGHLRRARARAWSGSRASGSTSFTPTTTAASRARTELRRRSCARRTTSACSSPSPSRISAITNGRRPTPTRPTATRATRRSTCAPRRIIRPSSFYSMSHNATGYERGHESGHDRWRFTIRATLVAQQRQARLARRSDRAAARSRAASFTITPRATSARCTRSISIRTSCRSRNSPTGSSTGRRRA